MSYSFVIVTNRKHMTFHLQALIKSCASARVCPWEQWSLSSINRFQYLEFATDNHPRSLPCFFFLASNFFTGGGGGRSVEDDFSARDESIEAIVGATRMRKEHPRRRKKRNKTNDDDETHYSLFCDTNLRNKGRKLRDPSPTIK